MGVGRFGGWSNRYSCGGSCRDISTSEDGLEFSGFFFKIPHSLF